MTSLPSLVLACSISITRAASPTTFAVPVNVIGPVFVAQGTVSDGQLVSDDGRHSSSVAETSPEILLKSDGFKMPWVHAAADSAEVVNLKPVWNLSAEMGIRNSVGLFGDVVIASDKSISASVERPHVNPAAGFRKDFDLKHQTFNRWEIIETSHASLLRGPWSGLRDADTSLRPVSILPQVQRQTGGGGGF